jgi:hypothetical protein
MARQVTKASVHKNVPYLVELFGFWGLLMDGRTGLHIPAQTGCFSWGIWESQREGSNLRPADDEATALAFQLADNNNF